MTTYEYNSNNDLIRKISDAGTDPGKLNYTWNYNYVDGNLQSVTDPENNTISYTYNTYGQVATLTDGEGNVTEFFL